MAVAVADTQFFESLKSCVSGEVSAVRTVISQGPR